MSNHTPGPWIVEWGDKTPIYVSPESRHEYVSICKVLPIDDEIDCDDGDFIVGSQTKANAHLIAAAPELLAACEAAEWNSLDLPEFVVERLLAAIAKAKGEQP